MDSRITELLKECIEFHHSHDDAQTYKKEALLIHTANIFSALIEIQSDDLDDAPQMNEQVRKLFANDAGKVKKICSRIKKKYLDNKKIFLDAMV